jgi:hypothetical protein
MRTGSPPEATRSKECAASLRRFSDKHGDMAPIGLMTRQYSNTASAAGFQPVMTPSTLGDDNGVLLSVHRTAV